MTKSLLFPATIALVWAIAARSEAADAKTPEETPVHRDARLAWWREARFGLFLHWGPVSLQGTEIGWSRAGERRGYPYGPGKEVPLEIYDNLYKRFNPTRYNPDEWVALAQAAGMKYVVLTSRHHDGFSMFNTKASGYKITSAESPYRRDIVAALAEACHRGGVHFGLYYSQPDWHNPDAFTPDGHERYNGYLKTQLTELMSNYGKVDYLFFDGLGPTTPENPYGGPDLNGLARRLQPQIIINDRNGPPSDFNSPEQKIGGFRLDRPWETCMTLGDQWSYKPGDRIKSLEQCVHTLVRCAGGDGNLLLNVGPMPDGEIEPRQAERLRQIGAWLKRNGEAIYATRGGPLAPTAAYATTRKGNNVYIHVLTSKGETMTLPPIHANIVSARFLSGETASVEATASGLSLRITEAERQPLDTIIRLDLDRPASTLPPALP
jgi:alpha-L-fucosidase